MLNFLLIAMLGIILLFKMTQMVSIGKKKKKNISMILISMEKKPNTYLQRELYLQRVEHILMIWKLEVM